MKKLILTIITLFLFMLIAPVNAQDAWKKITLKGTVTYSSVTTTKNFDVDGEVVGANESEETFTSDQVFTFFVDRFGMLAGSEKMLMEYTDANANILLTGGNVVDENAAGEGSFPITYSSRSETWGSCWNEDNKALRLMSTSEVSDELPIHGCRTSLWMIPIRSQEAVDEDKMMAKAMDKFAEMVMAEKRARDIREGKKINEDDYFVPANLYYSDIYGLYLFTSVWQKGSFSTHTPSKDRYYDCDLEQWTDSEGKMNVTIPLEERLQQNSNEDGIISYSQYIGIDKANFREFVRNPNKETTFIGGSIHFNKDYTGESETRTIIRLTIAGNK